MARNLPFFERNLRRARVYTGRVLRSGILPPPRHPCVFMHMPKCGGTSISAAMYGTIPLGKGVAVIDAVSTRRAAAIMHFDRDDATLCHEDLPDGDKVFDLREKILLQQMAWGSWLIHGHLLFSQKADTHFGSRYRYVTLLRDPVERMISNYRMAVNAGVVPEGLDTYLTSAIARSHAQVYLRYLSGQTVVSDDDMDKCVIQAQTQLARFSVVGFLDDLPDFQRQYRKVFSVPLRIKSYNRGNGEMPSLNSTQIRKIHGLCAADREIFESAQQTRDQRYQT